MTVFSTYSMVYVIGRNLPSLNFTNMGYVRRRKRKKQMALSVSLYKELSHEIDHVILLLSHSNPMKNEKLRTKAFSLNSHFLPEDLLKYFRAYCYPCLIYSPPELHHHTNLILPVGT